MTRFLQLKSSHTGYSPASEQQIATWQKQNEPQFTAQRQLAQSLSASISLQPLPTNVQPNIPENASPALVNFLTTQARLANARAQIHNQMLAASPQTPSAVQVNQMQQQEMQAFRQQYASGLRAQAQQARTLASQAQPTTVPTLPPVQLPPNVSPQMAAFLTLRHQLMQSRIQMLNQCANFAPSVQAAAMEQWQQQNSTQLAQARAQAKLISQTDQQTQQ